MQLDPKADCRPWPLAGYAPGNYTCKCIDCEERFSGDKRAIRCLECAAVVANQRLQAMPVPRSKEATMQLDQKALIEEAVQASIDAGLAVNGEYGVAAARHAARFMFNALQAVQPVPVVKVKRDYSHNPTDEVE